MKIKILGTGCAGCVALYEVTKQAVDELGISATVTKEDDMMIILSYDILAMPGLVIDEKVVSSGKRLTVSEIKILLSRFS